MESQRKLIERIDAAGLIVDLHIVVDGLLVAQVEVVFLMVRRDAVVTRQILLFLLLLVILVVLVVPFASIRVQPDLLQGLVPA